MKKTARWLAALFVASSGLAQAGPVVFINEFHYDNAGTDSGEFVEIAGPAGTDLSTYSIVLYNGSGGIVYRTDALAGAIADQQNGFGTVSISYPSNGIQNGAPDGIALVSAGVVIQFLSYEGAFTAADGPASGMTSLDIGVFQSGLDSGTSLQLQGTGSEYGDFVWAGGMATTKDLVNVGQAFASAAAPEPPTCMMLLFGLALLGSAVRRRVTG